MSEGNQNKETLLDLSQKNASISPMEPQIPAFHLEKQKPRSKKWLWIILIIVLVLIIGVGGYFYYYYIYLGKYDFSKYQNGPNLPILEKDVASFFYSKEMETIYYQKINDSLIYGDFLSLDKKNWPTLDIKGGNLLSVSPGGKKAIIYYVEESKDIKDSQGNYFIANLEDNKMFSMGGRGNTYENFLWLENDLIFTRNGTEILDYDFDLSKYQYNPDVSNFKKLADLTYPLISMAAKPDTNELYLLSDLSKKNSDFANNPVNNETGNNPNFTLSKFDPVEKKFTKILETKANFFDFSPSGKYYVFYDENNLDLSIYDTEKKSLVGQISSVSITPYKIIWIGDEKEFYYFSPAEKYSSNPRLNLGGFGYYSNLTKYNIETKTNIILSYGKEKNLADINNYYLSAQNKLILNTAQTNNLYELEIK